MFSTVFHCITTGEQRFIIVFKRLIESDSQGANCIAWDSNSKKNIHCQNLTVSK